MTEDDLVVLLRRPTYDEMEKIYQDRLDKNLSDNILWTLEERHSFFQKYGWSVEEFVLYRIYNLTG